MPGVEEAQSTPPGDLVESSIDQLRAAGWIGMADEVTLEWGRRSTRTRSVVQPLTIRQHGGEPIRLWYKRFHDLGDPGLDAWWREGLEAGARCGSHLLRHPDPVSRRLPLTVATDARASALMMTHVAGAPIERRQVITAGRRAQGAWEGLGVTLRSLEDVGARLAPADVGHLSDHEQLSVRAGGVVARRLGDRGLGTALEEAVAEAVRDLRPSHLVRAHGDLSVANVVRDRGSLALVDVGWVTALRGFDAASIIGRLRAMRLPRRSTSRVVSAVRAGYAVAPEELPAYFLSGVRRLPMALGRGERAVGSLVRQLLGDYVGADRG